MMLKDLFKFHSKEEDFRVKCLILILLGCALIINPANAADNHFHMNDMGCGGTTITYDWGIDCSSDAACSPYNQAHNGSTVQWSFDMGTLSGCHFIIEKYSGGTWNTYATYADNEEPTGSFIVGTDIPFKSTAGYEVYFRPKVYSSGDGSSQYAGHFLYVNTTYESSLPPAPVINDFTNDMSCYYPNQAIAFSSDVEGDLEDQLTWTWTWEIYDGETKISEDTDPVEVIMTAPGVGVYDVQLTVTNEGGTDFLQKLNMINVTLAGNCTGINNWTPFPTVPTVTPTAAVFPTMTVPPVPFINKTGINDMVNESLWGNYSAAYRKYIDEVGDSVNQTVTGATGLVMTPFAFIVQGIAVVLDLFSTSLASLMTYTTVPLSITARIINVMPWQIQSIITAGLAIDAIFLLVLGKG